jgi:hypothetical protein
LCQRRFNRTAALLLTKKVCFQKMFRTRMACAMKNWHPARANAGSGAARVIEWLIGAKLFRGKASVPWLPGKVSHRPVDAALLQPNFSAMDYSTPRFAEDFAVSGQRP